MCTHYNRVLNICYLFLMNMQDMTKRVKAWTRKSSYGEDLSFLNQDIWPTVIDDQVSSWRYIYSYMQRSLRNRRN